MDVQEAIRLRRSIRAYRDQPVPDDLLRRVLEAARLAPSACNWQAWRFIAVRDAGQRGRLKTALGGNRFVEQAPVILAFCAMKDDDMMSCGQKAGTVDCSIALAFVTLAAAAEGLGTCWLGDFDEGAVKGILGAPAGARVVAVSPLGWPAEAPEARSRKAFEEVVGFDRW